VIQAPERVLDVLLELAQGDVDGVKVTPIGTVGLPIVAGSKILLHPDDWTRITLRWKTVAGPPAKVWGLPVEVAGSA
jgi:hypothetical protein